MQLVIDFIAEYWSTVLIPVAVFAFSLISLVWLQRLALDRLGKWSKKVNWSVGNTFIPSLRGPLLLLCFILSLYFGLLISRIPESWKVPASNVIWTLFAVAITMTALNLTKGAAYYYGRKLRLQPRTILVARNVAGITILIVSCLVILDIWGLPTSPLLLLIGVIALIAAFASRDAAPNFLAGLQIAASRQIRVGDYIRLEDDEQGYVTQINWNATRLRGLDNSTIFVPNNTLIRQKFVNYGHHLKEAKEPFRFNTRSHLVELTGLKARNLQELVDILKQAPDEVIFYHTYGFLEEHQYLIPRLSNDFALWVNDSLGNETLAKQLAGINSFEVKSLGLLRDKLVEIMEEYISNNSVGRPAILGKEFYFKKSVSTVVPTPYVARDLREFMEALRKISPASLYLHFLESRLKPGNETNDFSRWLKTEMAETQLGEAIAQVDPRDCTLEELRSSLIRIIEKRVK